jgi:hypothetical protein
MHIVIVGAGPGLAASLTTAHWALTTLVMKTQAEALGGA